MTPFLQQIATLFYEQYGSEIHRLAFVFPNQRSGLFFRKYLSQQTRKPLFSPTILTINELFFRLSDKQPADRIHMLFVLYHIYKRHSRSDESFDDFIFWGEMLLNDFNDIDKYLVDAAHLFTNIKDIHQIDRDFSYLQPEQVEAIRTFWSSFQPKGHDEIRQNFLDVWQHLHAIYLDFKKELSAEGFGYDGMIFREVIEKVEKVDHFDKIDTVDSIDNFDKVDKIDYIDSIDHIDLIDSIDPIENSKKTFEKIIFIGLNALSPAEKRLLKALQKQGVADFYWDCGSEWLMDADNKASLFIRDHLRQFPSAHTLPAEQHTLPEIELIGMPSRIGQAKQVHHLLQAMQGGQAEPDPEEMLRTAIVLPDEQLLIPVLYAIPNTYTHINVTLGYPLSHTPVASLMQSIADLQKKTHKVDNLTSFYHREVLALLNHQYIVSVCPDEVAGLVKDITEHNRIFIPSTDLHRTPLLGLIFQPVTVVATIASYLLQILMELNRMITSRQGEKEKAENDAVAMGELEQEFIYHYFTMVNRLKDQIETGHIALSVETFFHLLKRLTDTITIPFYGKPLSGIQIMGVLETRVLDFDRLIILSMNEGIFPGKATANSFIPYSLRRGFGLPVYEHQDSVWSYHFYRLIARAKKVSLLYDTRTEGLQKGEVSRFVHQLRYQYNVPVKEKIVVFNITSTQPVALQIGKTGQVMAKMQAYHTGGSKALSASTINTYIDCPLKFYFGSIEGLKEEEEVSEHVENKVFGNIFHKVVERLYAPFCGSVVTSDILRLRTKEQTVTEAIQQAFAEFFFRSKEVRPLSGQHYLTGEMIRKYALKLIERDCELTPFRYIQSEEKIKHTFRLTNGTDIQLKGFIDRLDEVTGTVRVVDYKTGGKKGLDYRSMESLFDATDDKRQSAILQAFMYAYMYGHTETAKPIQPLLYYVRDFFSDSFAPIICQGKEKQPVTDFANFRAEFEACLRACLDGMFNPAIPFVQTSCIKICERCPFTVVCGK